MYAAGAGVSRRPRLATFPTMPTISSQSVLVGAATIHCPVPRRGIRIFRPRASPSGQNRFAMA